MIQVRDTFQVKFGKIDAAVDHWNRLAAVVPAWPKGRDRYEVLTDLSGDMFALSTALHLDSDDAWHKMNATVLASPEYQEWFKLFKQYVEEGHREFHTVEQANPGWSGVGAIVVRTCFRALEWRVEETLELLRTYGAMLIDQGVGSRPEDPHRRQRSSVQPDHRDRSHGSQDMGRPPPRAVSRSPVPGMVSAPDGLRFPRLARLPQGGRTARLRRLRMSSAKRRRPIACGLRAIAANPKSASNTSRSAPGRLRRPAGARVRGRRGGRRAWRQHRAMENIPLIDSRPNGTIRRPAARIPHDQEFLMSDPRTERLATVLVQYSTRIQPGDRVAIESEVGGLPLVRALFERILQAGGHPYLLLSPGGMITRTGYRHKLLALRRPGPARRRAGIPPAGL